MNMNMKRINFHRVFIISCIFTISTTAVSSTIDGTIDSVIYGNNGYVSDITTGDPFSATYLEHFDVFLEEIIKDLHFTVGDTVFYSGGGAETIWEDDIGGVDRLTINGYSESSNFYIYQLTLIAEDSTGQAFSSSQLDPIDLTLFDDIRISYYYNWSDGEGSSISAFTGVSIVPVPSAVGYSAQVLLV